MNEWELCKENVEPLKEGRKMDSLKAALNRTEKENNKRESIRKEYELELRTYAGDDPLSVYYKYILWLQQNYPEGGQDAKLPTVIQKCIETFFTCEQYLNDARFLEIFFKFIKNVDDPLEIYNHFYDHGFGRTLSEFYINWSWQLENRNCIKRANEILEKGLENGADPQNTIIEAQKQLQMRLAKNIASGQLEYDVEDDEKRKPLNKLKEKKKKGKSEAPVKRVGNAVVNDNEKLKNVQQNVDAKKLKTKPLIYEDENNIDSAVTSAVITKSKSNKKSKENDANHLVTVRKENEQKPERWCDNRLKQKKVKVQSKPEFEILLESDDDGDTPLYKPPEANALRFRRNEDSPPLAIFEKPDPKKKYMFNANKIYAGGVEFSFEELRGRKWLTAKRKEEEKARNQKLEDEVAQLRQQVALLLQTQNNQQNTKKNSIVVSENKETSLPPSAESSTGKSSNFSYVSKGALSIMRELWNGTLVNSEYDNITSSQPNSCEKDPNENFKIYSESSAGSKDSEHPKFDSEDKDISQYTHDAFTIALPKDEDDCIPCCASTPVMGKTSRRVISGLELDNAENNETNNFIGGMTAKLSPIVETSREYNSKSSSSSSGTMSTTGVSTHSRRIRALSGMALDQIDPFDCAVITRLLELLMDPIDSRKGFYRIQNTIPKIKKKTKLKLGRDYYLIDRLIAKGNYAQVYAAQIIDDSQDSYKNSYSSSIMKSASLSKIETSCKWFALKVQSHATQEWEFYICDELHKRLTRSKVLPDIELSVMSVDPTVIFHDACVIVDEYCFNGTLIDVINECRKQKKSLPKSLTAYFALELLLIVQQVHKCDIIHADLKPDNVLILNFPSREDVTNVLKRTSVIKLIDFGRSIDMSLLPSGTTFNLLVQTKGSECCEMKDAKPWTFQTDWFGVLDCIHLMLFTEYIKIKKNKSLKWEIHDKFNRRHHQPDIWESLFETLLNIPSCHEMPDLFLFIDKLNEYVKQNIDDLEEDSYAMEMMMENARKQKNNK